MKAILDVISGEIGGNGIACLPCERINLDYQRFTEYVDSDEHRAGEVFEHTHPKTNVIDVRHIDDTTPSILRFFLDGSRRTYKVADLLVGGWHL